MEGKQAILLHLDTLKANLGVLSDFQAGVLFKCIVAYECDEDFQIQDPLVKLAFDNIKLSLDFSRKQYNERCEKNRENVKKRWAKASEYDRINRNTNEYETLPTNTNSNPNTDTDTTEVVIEEYKEEKEKRFVKPTIEEVHEYFTGHLRCSNYIEADEFYNYYESNGWKVGKNVMKKWTAAASGWHSREQQKRNTHGTDRQTYERNLGAALAQQCAELRQRELDTGGTSQSGYVPRKLSGK